MRNKYKDQKSIEQQFAEAKLVPEKDKENFVPALVIGGTALIYRYASEITEAAVKYGLMLLSIIMDPPKISKEKADEIDNLGDIKNYKSIIISNNEDIKKVETLDVEEDTLVMLTKGSTKNERKSNPKKVTKAKEELKELNKKPNKTPEDKRKIKVIEKKIKKELSKMKKSENHSQIGKHS